MPAPLLVTVANTWHLAAWLIVSLCGYCLQCKYSGTQAHHFNAASQVETEYYSNSRAMASEHAISLEFTVLPTPGAERHQDQRGRRHLPDPALLALLPRLEEELHVLHQLGGLQQRRLRVHGEPLAPGGAAQTRAEQSGGRSTAAVHQ